MHEIIGIVPGAGKVSKIGEFFRYLTPIKVNPIDKSKFVVVSEQIIENLRMAGASPIYFVVNKNDDVVFSYFTKQDLFTDYSFDFRTQGNIDKYYGMPFAIDRIYNDSQGKIVLFWNARHYYRA